MGGGETGAWFMGSEIIGQDKGVLAFRMFEKIKDPLFFHKP